MEALKSKNWKWWLSLALRALALAVIGEAVIRAGSAHLDPKLDEWTDPKYLGVTMHFWECLCGGAILFLVGWWLKGNASEHQRA